MNRLKSIYASAYAAAVNAIVVVMVTVAAELSAPFKNWLTGFTGHHWVTKSWLTVLVFVLSFGAIFFLKKNVSAAQTKKSLLFLQGALGAAFLIILTFYFYEFFKG